MFHVLNQSGAPTDVVRETRVLGRLCVLNETWQQVPLPVFAMVVMPNHWHFVVRPSSDDQVSDFFRRLTVTHTMRWHAHYRSSGTGHLYQGRFKSFPVQSDEHLLTVMRYVERNPLRANSVARAEDWKWGSAFTRQQKPPLPLWHQKPTAPKQRRNSVANGVPGSTDLKQRRKSPLSDNASGEAARSAALTGPEAA